MTVVVRDGLGMMCDFTLTLDSDEPHPSAYLENF